MKTSYNGKITRINLTTGEIKTEELDLELAKKIYWWKRIRNKDDL